ncbi:unnamed protein product, partial [Allacma fusca]
LLLYLQFSICSNVLTYTSETVLFLTVVLTDAECDFCIGFEGFEGHNKKNSYFQRDLLSSSCTRLDVIKRVIC